MNANSNAPRAAGTGTGRSSISGHSSSSTAGRKRQVPTIGSRESFNEFEAAQLFLQRANPIRCIGREWWIHETGVWSRQSRDTLRPIAQGVMHPSVRTAQREEAIMRHVEGAQQINESQLLGFYKFDGDAILLNTADCVLRISRAGSIRAIEQKPEQYFTLKTAARYDQNARCDLFERTLEAALPSAEDRRLLQFFAGYCLLPDCRHEVCVVCHGPGGSGKSTVLGATGDALGAGLVTHLAMSQLCGSESYHLPCLKHAVMNLGTELDSLEVAESSNFKALVSGEPIQVRPIYGKPFVMKSAAKLVFLGNDLPRFRHGTDAELRRIRFLRFEHKPVSPDTDLKHKLQAEKDGIFTWMLDGLSALLTRGEIPLGGETSQASLSRFAISNDPIGAFIQPRLQPNAYIPKEELARQYAEFCERHGFPPEFSSTFFKRLYDRFPNVEDAQKQMPDGRRVRIIKGIASQPCTPCTPSESHLTRTRAYKPSSVANNGKEAVQPVRSE